MKKHFRSFLALLLCFYANFLYSAENSTIILVEDNKILAKIKNLDVAPLTPRDKIHYFLLTGELEKAKEAVEKYYNESEKLNPWVTELFTFQYSTLISALELSQQHNVKFEDAFRNEFQKFLNSFDKQYVNYIPEHYARGLPPLKRQVESSLKEPNFASNINLQSRTLNALFQYVLLTKTKNIALQLLANFEKYHLVILENQRIALESGESLQATVYLPKEKVKQSLPSVLVYNLYAQGWNIDNKAIEAAMKGYAGVVVYPRGKGTSLGKIEPFKTEAKDGYQIIDWISKQSWSNKKVAMVGGSYLGFTQWAVTKKLHPALKTIVPSTSVVPGFNDNLTENHILSAEALSWYHLVTNSQYMDFGSYYDPRWGDVYRNYFINGLPFNELSASWLPDNDAYNTWLKNQDNNDYWAEFMPDSISFSKLNIPVLATTGYFDHAQLGTWYYAHKHYKNNPKAEHYIVIGPYDHLGANGMPRNNVMGYELEQAAHINLNRLIFEWFDYVLKDQEKPSLLKNKVNYQLMGANEWRHESYEEYQTGVQDNFYLSSAEKGLKLAKVRNHNNSSVVASQIVDYSNRESSLNPLRSGAKSHTINTGNEMIFYSEPFNESTVISGHLKGELKLEINAHDLDLVAVLYEKNTSGEHFKIGHYKARASYHVSSQGRVLLTPGRATKVTIQGTPFFSRKVAKGSQLVLVLSALKDSKTEINYGAAKPVNQQSLNDMKEPLIIKVYNDSFISLTSKEN